MFSHINPLERENEYVLIQSLITVEHHSGKMIKVSILRRVFTHTTEKNHFKHASIRLQVF